MLPEVSIPGKSGFKQANMPFTGRKSVLEKRYFVSLSPESYLFRSDLVRSD